MEPEVWPPLHCEALREFVTRGMSYKGAADAINARFGTAYSRNAALGRARRMGLGEPDRPKSTLQTAESQSQRAVRSRADDSALLKLLRRRPVFPRVEGVQLRCVEVAPRHLELIEIGESGCRYPYGGDAEGEAITFCGLSRCKGSSYCTPHFHLTRNPDIPVKRVISSAPLRLVAAVGKFQVEVVGNGTQEAPEGIRSFNRT